MSVRARETACVSVSGGVERSQEEKKVPARKYTHRATYGPVIRFSLRAALPATIPTLHLPPPPVRQTGRHGGRRNLSIDI